jgi:hypothetical protein
MRYEARLSAYDVMDQVHVGCNVRATEGELWAPAVEVLLVTTTIRGEGISDPREWLRDALIALLETL